MGQEQDFVRLRVVQSLFEAQQAAGLLDQEGLTCMVVSYRDTALDGLYQAHKGWGELRVPADVKQRAQEILGRHLAAATSIDEAELDRLASVEPAPEQAPATRGNRTALTVLSVAVGGLAVIALYLLFSR